MEFTQSWRVQPLVKGLTDIHCLSVEFCRLQAHSTFRIWTQIDTHTDAHIVLLVYTKERNPTNQWYRLYSGESSELIILNTLDNQLNSFHENLCLWDLLTMFCKFPQAICVKDVSPNIQSCQLIQDGSAMFQCKGELLISLDSRECDRVWALHSHKGSQSTINRQQGL